MNQLIQDTGLQKTKSAIIGRIWINSDEVSLMPASYTLTDDMEFGPDEAYILGKLSFRTDRNLNASLDSKKTEKIYLKAGDKLFFYPTTKRANHDDPDYTVSARFPEPIAEAIIENGQKAQKEWKDAQGIETE